MIYGRVLINSVYNIDNTFLYCIRLHRKRVFCFVKGVYVMFCYASGVFKAIVPFSSCMFKNSNFN